MESIVGLFERVNLEYLKGNMLKQKKYVYKNILINVFVEIKYNYFSNIWVNGQIYKILKENMYVWDRYLIGCSDIM